MSINDQLLAAMLTYGLPVLFGVIMAASVGVPLPASLMLIAAGAFTQTGDLSYWWVVAVGVAGALLGDNLGYLIGWSGGRPMALKLSRWFGGPERLAQAEAAAARYGGVGIFLSRWLLSPIGPAINLTSGIAAYTWQKFVLWDLAGEFVWVVLYTVIGRMFSDRIQAMSDLLSDAAGTLVGLVAVIALGMLLLRQMRAGRAQRSVASSPQQGKEFS